MDSQRVLLGKIAHARSGDKGNSSNIGVIAFDAEGYEFLKRYLTADKVKAFFRHLQLKDVVRYEIPNLGALNFVLTEALAGGGSRSLRIDSQGKAFGQAILEMEVDLSEDDTIVK